MSTADALRLVVLAALWGASFLLFRIVVPSLGVIATAEGRVLVAGLVLLAWHAIARVPFDWVRHRRPMAVVGVFNSALPFALFAFAARSLPAGYLAILNATAPLFGALVARAWLGEPLGVRRIAGVVVGCIGVATLVRLGPATLDARAILSCIACLAASASYGVAGNYARQDARDVPPTAMATGSQLAASIALAPLLPFAIPTAIPTFGVIVALLLLAVACTAVAYLLYFRLIANVGATRALTVTFLVPVFAIAWAWAVLDEAPTLRMSIGASLVIVATWLVVGRAPPRVTRTR